MALPVTLVRLVTVILSSTTAFLSVSASCGDNTTAAADGISTAPSKKEVMEAWKTFLSVDSGNVTLLAFDGTILETNIGAKSLRKKVSPLSLHRGTVMKYASADHWQTFSDDPGAPWGIVQIEGMIEGTMADHEGPHLLTANLHNMFIKVTWDATCGTYTICLASAGYIKDLMTDENYVRWGQDVEGLLAGASVTALVNKLFLLADRLPGWDYCPQLSSDKDELAGFAFL